MKDRTISPGIAGAVIAIVLASAASFEWRAMVQGKNRHAKDPATMTAQMCQSCHASAKMLAAMKLKQGAHNTAPVFLPVAGTASHAHLAAGAWPIK